MPHFAQINEQGIVERIVIASKEFIELNSNILGPISSWIETFPNTHLGKGLNEEPSRRKNHAFIGCSYDKDRDAFIAPKPFNSWVLDENTCDWVPPHGNMEEEAQKGNVWDENTLSWRFLKGFSEDGTPIF